MAEEHFVLRYDGEAIIDGRIEARDLGLSLVGMADLLHVAQSKDDQLATEDLVSLKVQATEEGSFEIDLILSAMGSVWDVIRNTLTTDDVGAVANLAALLELSRQTISQIKTHGGKTVKEYSEADEDTVLVSFTDGTQAAMGRDTFLIWNDRKARKSAYELVKPLERDGVDTLEIKDDANGEPKVTVTKADLDSFSHIPELPNVPLEDEKADVYVTLVNVGLGGGKGWRFDDGEREFRAEIEDAEFLEAVLGGQLNFAAGDEARVFLRHERRQTPKTVRSDYFIELVRRVRRPGQTRPVWDEEIQRRRTNIDGSE